MTKLPDGWETKRLDEIADIVMGQSPPGSSYNEHGEGQPFFQGKTEFGEVHPTVRKYTTAGTKFAKAGDILMSVRAPVGPTNIADIDCVIGRGLAAIRAKTVVSQDYLRWSLKHLEIDIQSKGTGTTFDAITGETLRGTLVTLPPIDEQHKIVELLEDHLSRLGAALADVQQAKVKAAQLRRSLLQAAFTGNLELGESSRMAELPETWKSSTIGEVAEIVRGVTYSKSDTLSATDNDAVPLLRATNLEVDSIDFEDMVYVPKRVVKAQQYLQLDDIFLAASSGSISVVGKSAQVVKTNGETFGAFCAVIRPKNINPKFLAYWVQSPATRDHWSATAKGTNINNLKPSDISETNIPIPPIDEQNKIVELLEDHLSRLDASVSLVDAMEKQSNGLRRSLLQAAFTGQLTKEVVSV